MKRSREAVQDLRLRKEVERLRARLATAERQRGELIDGLRAVAGPIPPIVGPSVRPVERCGVCVENIHRNCVADCPGRVARGLLARIESEVADG